ncbi:MAG TPA: hypothetical protein VFU13_21310 [Steroidobacteraceae bacterium]|nr:hypothetical protein [Steroidobacteraceae bacterium]
MKHPRTIVVAVALLLAAAWWLVRDARERGTAAATAPTGAADSRETTSPDAGAQRVAEGIPKEMNAEVASSADAPGPNWSKRLRESDDYWAFAESAIGPAKRGDGDAQYWLALALNECEFVYPTYFIEERPGKPARRRTLDEARERVAGMRSLHLADDMTLLEKRCDRLSRAEDAPFGNGQEWMEAARAIDNPNALAAEAAVKSLSSMHDEDPERARKMRAEIRRLSVEATRTGDPEALARIGAAAANLAFKDAAESRRREWSWLLAACLRAPDCDVLTSWRKSRCAWDTQCQPYETPQDIIQRDAGSEFSEVERRAREINEKIDAGTLQESDI